MSISRLFDNIAFWGIVSAIAVSAIPNGTVMTWHKSLLVVAICIFGLFRVAADAARKQFRFAQPLLLLPLVGLLGLALVQLIPAPDWAQSYSLDPYETKLFIVVFGGVVAAGEALLVSTTTERRLAILAGTVFCVGFASAMFGFMREAFFEAPNGLLAEFILPDQGYAQFINQNHFSVLMEMTFGLALGLLVKGRFSERAKFAAALFLVFIVFAMIRANSRGGLVSFTAMCVFAVFVHLVTRSRSGRRSPRDEAPRRSSFARFIIAGGLSALIFAMLVVAVVFVGGERVVNRFEKVDLEVTAVSPEQINRASIWRATLHLIESRPVFGAGFGAYATAITRFDTSAGRYSLQQAHNEYLEILSNGGVIAFVLFGLFGVAVVKRAIDNLKSPRTFRQAACFGALIGIVGVLIHSFVDFGLHVVTNALIFGVLVVIATADIAQSPQGGVGRGGIDPRP